MSSSAMVYLYTPTTNHKDKSLETIDLPSPTTSINQSIKPPKWQTCSPTPSPTHLLPHLVNQSDPAQLPHPVYDLSHPDAETTSEAAAAASPTHPLAEHPSTLSRVPAPSQHICPVDHETMRRPAQKTLNNLVLVCLCLLSGFRLGHCISSMLLRQLLAGRESSSEARVGCRGTGGRCEHCTL